MFVQFPFMAFIIALVIADQRPDLATTYRHASDKVADLAI